MSQLNQDPQLLGYWVSDPLHQSTLAGLGDVELDFQKNGNLIYTIKEQLSDKIIIMTWRVDKNYIITNQHSKPNEQKSIYHIDSNGILSIQFDSEIFKFKRLTIA